MKDPGKFNGPGHFLKSAAIGVPIVLVVLAIVMFVVNVAMPLPQ